METGALPELFEPPNEESRRNYISASKDTVLLREIIQRHSIKDPKLLEDIFVYLVNNASNLVSINNIINYFKSNGRKTTYETLSTYLGYIEDTFLIHKVDRYDIRGKDTIAGASKYYANDLCFKNYLYPGFGYSLGYKLENLVYLELRRAGYDIYVGALRNKEVDFVAKKADRLIYIQSTYILLDDQTIEREYAPLEGLMIIMKKLWYPWMIWSYHRVMELSTGLSLEIKRYNRLKQAAQHFPFGKYKKLSLCIQDIDRHPQMHPAEYHSRITSASMC